MMRATTIYYDKGITIIIFLYMLLLPVILSRCSNLPLDSYWARTRHELFDIIQPVDVTYSQW